MTDEQLNPWSCNPVNLTNDEIKNPFSVIADFFSSDDVAGHLRELLEWRNCVLENRYYIDQKGNPSGILFTHQLHIKLIEAIHLLIQENWSEAMMTANIYHTSQLAEERNTWRYFPDNLSEHELLNPFLLIKSFFKVYSLPQYRYFLYEWLEAALSSRAAFENILPADIINVYENLQKLYSAVWLIFQRTANDPYLKVERVSVTEELPSLLCKANLYQLNTVISADKQELISKLIAIIKHKLETVQAVIYLGTPTARSDSLFLLILTANEEQRQAQALSAMIEESCQTIAKIVTLVHHKSIVLNLVKEDNLFVRKALNCPVIYLSGDMMLPVYHSVLAANLRDVNLLWERWHKQGKDFLNGAEFYLQSGAINAALFSLQQCTECMLIAIIRTVLGYRINNHNLSTLLRITQMFTGDLASVFNLANKEDMELFNLLKHAYVNVRYKDQYEGNEKLVSMLLVVVRKLVAVIENIYQTHLMTSSL